MNPAVKTRPIIPPTVTPMIVIMETPLELLPCVVEIEEEGVDVSMFPTVDSGKPTARVALTGSNVSARTTLRYAHAGTAVAELISFGYLLSNVNCSPKGATVDTLG